MNTEPPVKRNMFLIAVVILFNLVWLALLFLSCQADENRQLEVTPTIQVLEQYPFRSQFAMNEFVGGESPDGRWFVGEILSLEDENYKGLLAKPPSTWSITPVI